MSSAWSVDYFSQLGSSTASCSFSTSVLPSQFQAAFNLTSYASLGRTQCGVFYQAQSELPGKGPCYPVFVETAEFMHR